MLLAMLTAVALAGPLPNNADLLRQIARDDTVDAHTRIEAALMALDIVESQGVDLKTQNLVENLFAEPCDEPATEIDVLDGDAAIGQPRDQRQQPIQRLGKGAELREL